MGTAVVAGLIAFVVPASPRAQRAEPRDAHVRTHLPVPPATIVTPDPRAQQAPAVPPAVGGTWTQLSNLPPAAVDNCLLMTDATVLCHQQSGRNWYRLTPSNTGSYQAGTWALDSTMQAGYAPLYFAAAVLSDGSVIVEGGEYECSSGICNEVWEAKGSYYNPTSHTWTAVNPPSVNGVPWSTIGDAQSVVLADGTFMLADCCSGKAAYFNPATLTWTPVSGHQADDYHDEENWTLLPDRRVLTVDAWPAGSRLSEIYDPATQQWTSAGNTPVALTDNTGASASYEQGPGILRPNGTVVYFGANATGAGHTAIYNSTTGVWSAGPDFGGADNAADAPAALLPNGNVLAQASPGLFLSPSHWYEVDYSNGALTQVTSPSYAFSPSSYWGQMLVLPTGQILQTEFSNDVRLYTPTGTYQAAWQPTITSVSSTLAPGTSYTISGTQFNGLSQGAAYGDDWQSATNYPIVRITNTATGHVVFAKTHNHSTMAVATGGQTVSTTFDVPSSIETGASTIEVIANGIPSARTNVSVQRGRAASGAPGDADGDGKSDVTIYRASTGGWWTLKSSGNFATYDSRSWGLAGDTPVPGDYDGDGKMDLAIYRPSNGTWWILKSSTSFGTYSTYGWGLVGDTPVQADYDGDGKTDLAIYRPSNGTWWILKSSTNFSGYVTYGWGLPSDVPVVGDYDGDGLADPAIYRPSNGSWWFLKSSTSFGTYGNYGWGLTGDTPVAADYDGDGKTDLAVFRPSNGTWWILKSSGNFSTYNTYGWGLVGDVPVVGDYDGDSKNDLAIYRPSNGSWWILKSSTNYGTYSTYGWGLSGDVPVFQRP